MLAAFLIAAPFATALLVAASFRLDCAVPFVREQPNVYDCPPVRG